MNIVAAILLAVLLVANVLLVLGTRTDYPRIATLGAIDALACVIGILLALFL
jgi:hypothetical protein